MNIIKRMVLFGLVSTTLLLAGCEGTYLSGPMSLVLTLDLISAAGDHTAAATLSLAGVITTTTTDTTISTATASVFIIFTAADFTAVVGTARDELLLICTSSSYSSSYSFSNSRISRTDVANRGAIAKI